MYVLILSASWNPHAELIGDSLAKRDVTPIRLDMDRLGEQTPELGINFDAGCPTAIRLGDHCLCTEDVISVFAHHPRIGFGNRAALDEIDYQLAHASWKNAINWFELTFTSSRWINSIDAAKTAASTANQLRVARDCGLRTPATCFTNKLSILRAFEIIHPQIILKSGSVPGIVPDGSRLLTHPIRACDLNPEELLSAPCLFQEYIQKAYELRIHVVGNRVLACQIMSQANPVTALDWRNYAVSQTPHYPIKLNLKLTAACISLVRTLGLEFGVIDMIVTQDGENVFLECNAQGSWMWIEQLTGLRITQCLVDRLVQKPRP